MKEWRFFMINTRGVFRTQSEIYDETFFVTIVNKF